MTRAIIYPHKVARLRPPEPPPEPGRVAWALGAALAGFWFWSVLVGARRREPADSWACVGVLYGELGELVREPPRWKWRKRREWRRRTAPNFAAYLSDVLRARYYEIAVTR